MDPEGTARFVLEDLTVGAHAHGFGCTDTGQTFAFRVQRSTLHIEVYRADLDADVPDPSDIVAVAHCSVNDVDLDDERSVSALVRDVVGGATPVAVGGDGLTLRALLARLGAVIDSITDTR
ncbi:hypothetical protein GCM10023094_10020 [Rhodococcus olei]|uniref:Immunity protein 10 of polymorphic toxin system n=1 Tax=Rhodococcus olei TaxID=2161675 RepID=A0ABP8NV42_9NOCA